MRQVRVQIGDEILLSALEEFYTSILGFRVTNSTRSDLTLQQEEDDLEITFYVVDDPMSQETPILIQVEDLEVSIDLIV